MTMEHYRQLMDIVGTGVKAILLDAGGKPLIERLRVKTPQPATPANVLKAIRTLATQAGDFDRIGAGFPGVVNNGVVKTAPHLHKKWEGLRFDIEPRRSCRHPRIYFGFRRLNAQKGTYNAN